jgi:selenide,water dikinase
LSPAALDQVLGKLTRQNDPDLLIGFDKADDAGVYRLSPDLALVQTVDFFTPIVDDPYTFGQIAATNSLSDVYAMGGKPLSALTMVCFPDKGDLNVLEQILAGGLSKMIEARCTIAGGHSVRDPEIKFGYAVTGTIHPDRVFANATAKPGDALILTKAIGTGVISTAIKKGVAEQSWIDAATTSMTTLNRAAAEVMTRTEFHVHACTDVTGFGMIGHAREMASGSGVALTLKASAVPLLAGATECVQRGLVPGGLTANRDFAECCVAYGADIAEIERTLLFDPQTAGGLLLSVTESEAQRLVSALHEAGVEHATIVGSVHERDIDAALIQVI